MSSFTVDGFLVCYPVSVIALELEQDESLNSYKMSVAVGCYDDDDDGTEQMAVLVFTDWDLAYDHMAENYPKRSGAIVVDCEDAGAFIATLVDAKNSGINGVAFDVPDDLCNADIYEIDEVIEAASNAAEETEEDDGESDAGATEPWPSSDD